MAQNAYQQADQYPGKFLVVFELKPKYFNFYSLKNYA